MELLLQEKNVSLRNQEEETKKNTAKLLEKVRNIKILRKTLDSIDQVKTLAKENEQEVMKEF